MTRAHATALIATILTASLTAGASQTPARDTRAPEQGPVGTGAISGIVVADSGGSPVRFAHVVLIGALTGTLRVTSSDDAGRFAFANLPADRYLVGASKPPYLGAVAGARRPARMGSPIAVTADQKVTDVTIRLPRGAAITGVVTDERGQPAQGSQVSVMRFSAQNGQLTNAGSAATDDRGRYRLHSLPPGEYIVVASNERYGLLGPSAAATVLTDADVDAALKAPRSTPGPAAAVPPTPPGRPQGVPSATYAPVYFPGTTRVSDATPITLAAGDERQDADFRLEVVKTARIDGIVTGFDGTGPAGLAVRLASDAPALSGQFEAASRVMPDGRFFVSGVPPGAYTLLVRGTGARANEFAATRIDVAGMDLQGIQLTLRPALSFVARIAFDGGTPPPSPAGHRVPLRMLPPALTGMAAPQVSPTDASGTFTVTGLVPGRYVIGAPLFFGASADSVTWALQSVTIDGREVTDLAVEISADAVPANVVVTFSDRSQELSGRLLDAAGAPMSDYTVVVFPAEKQYWLPGSRRILTARPGTDGRFRFGGPGPVSLPAGNYLLAAVTDLARDEQFDTRLLEQLVPAGVKVTVQPGEKAVQDLVIK